MNEEKTTQEIEAAEPVSTSREPVVLRGSIGKFDVHVTFEATKTTGELGYDAYATSTGGKTFDGRDMPKWSELPERIRAAWSAAADAIKTSTTAVDHIYVNGRCLCGRDYHRGIGG